MHSFDIAIVLYQKSTADAPTFVRASAPQRPLGLKKLGSDLAARNELVLIEDLENRTASKDDDYAFGSGGSRKPHMRGAHAVDGDGYIAVRPVSGEPPLEQTDDAIITQGAQTLEDAQSGEKAGEERFDGEDGTGRCRCRVFNSCVLLEIPRNPSEVSPVEGFSGTGCANAVGDLGTEFFGVVSHVFLLVAGGKLSGLSRCS